MCCDTLFELFIDAFSLTSSISCHSLIILEVVFHGTQDEVRSSLHIHRHINTVLDIKQMFQC